MFQALFRENKNKIYTFWCLFWQTVLFLDNLSKCGIWNKQHATCFPIFVAVGTENINRCSFSRRNYYHNDCWSNPGKSITLMQTCISLKLSYIACFFTVRTLIDIHITLVSIPPQTSSFEPFTGNSLSSLAYSTLCPFFPKSQLKHVIWQQNKCWLSSRLSSFISLLSPTASVTLLGGCLFIYLFIFRLHFWS